jgi:hypothetical protein
MFVDGYAAAGFLPEDQLPASVESHEIILPFGYDARRVRRSESIVVMPSKNHASSCRPS